MTDQELRSLSPGDLLRRSFVSGRFVCYQVRWIAGEHLYLDLLDRGELPKEGLIGLIYKRFEVKEYELLDGDPL